MSKNISSRQEFLNNDVHENRKERRNRRGLKIAVCVLSALLALMTILFAVEADKNNRNSLSLEEMYQKNFYDLVDNINNTETNLSKVISATDSTYQAKLLEQISLNATLAQENLNNLPYSINGLDKAVTFINQTSGYTETLSKRLNKNQALTNTEIRTLENIYDSIADIKTALNKMSTEMWQGYSILETSASFEGDYNNFTHNLSEIKSNDVDYPTMIYDGPFSDSQINKEIKGLKGDKVSVEKAKQNLLKIFAEYSDDQIEITNETNGRFQTYDFNVMNEKQMSIAYIQMTQIGGKLLTMSSYKDETAENLTIENAKAIALDFVKKAGFEDMQIVWSDVVGANAFINLAPVEKNIILYPDLVKIKIDLSDGEVLGFEATSYYTNHTNRNLGSVTFSKEAARSKIAKNFVIQTENLALTPIDYGREVLCYEFYCTYGTDNYYFYINAQTGVEENILKQIQTDNGSLLM